MLYDMMLLATILLGWALLVAGDAGCIAPYKGPSTICDSGKEAAAKAASYSAGCNKPLPEGISLGKSKNVSIASGGLNRSYLIHLPETYKAKFVTPLIFSFHGRTKNAKEQEELSQLSNASYNAHAIAVYPQGERSDKGVRQWQGDPDASESVNDIQFTLDMIASLQSTYCIDTKRIYATGKSNGGGLVGLLACDARASAQIAAFAPVSGAFYLQDDGTPPPCNPSRSPVPILSFHGWKDTTIPYLGGPNASQRGFTIPIPSWLEAWLARNKCDGQPRAPSNATLGSPYETVCKKPKLARRYAWDCQGVEGAVQHFNVSNLGHDWPSTFPNDDGNVTACFDATSKIMGFFEANELP